jgi:predicted enzyme related to lactoylglutathione lyase
MRWLARISVACLLTTSIAAAEPFQEVTVGVPVSSISDAEAWYINLLGADIEVLRPFPGVVEFKVAPGVWFQIFEAGDQQTSGAVVRFLVNDIDATQRESAKAGIATGDAIEIPDVVTFSEFADPDGNALGFYDLP